MNPGAILRAILDGRITQVGNPADFEGFKALYVNHDQVAAIMGDAAPAALTLETFAKSVGIHQPARLSRLVNQIHAPATRMRNPKKHAYPFYITTEDADALHERFFTTRWMAKAFGRSWQSLSAEPRRSDIAPFSPDGIDYGPIYLRDAVCRALD